MSIRDNIISIKEKIALAAQRAGRKPEEVKFVAVSKTKPIALVREAMEAGQVDFGENKVQELREKHPLIPQINWHMIGHLQRNKVKYIAPFVYLIHSVESERLLQEIDKQAEKNGRTINCLLQLNISEEEAKSGLNESSAQELLSRMDQFLHVCIHGLMGMASLTDDRKLIRSQFRRLRNAFELFRQIDHPRIQMQELSMGMSGDYEIAIKEGATLLRIGSAVFGAREKN